MKRMVDNAQTLNQVAKYTDVVENDTNATLQWEGNVEINGNVHTKPKEIVELVVPSGGLTLTPDTSKRYHITQGVDMEVCITIEVPYYKIAWDYETMSLYEFGGKNDWLSTCTDGWLNETSMIDMAINNGTFVDIYVWFDEINRVMYIAGAIDI